MSLLYLDKNQLMSDIGPIHGLGALIICLGLLFINTLFLTISVIFLLIERKNGRRLIKQFSAKGLLVSTIILEIILLALMLFIEYSHDQNILKFIDLVSPGFAVTAILAMIIINIKYSRQSKIIE